MADMRRVRYHGALRGPDLAAGTAAGPRAATPAACSPDRPPRDGRRVPAGGRGPPAPPRRRCSPTPTTRRIRASGARPRRWSRAAGRSTSSRSAGPGDAADGVLDGVRVHRLDVQRHQGAGLGATSASTSRSSARAGWAVDPGPSPAPVRARPGPHAAGLPRRSPRCRSGSPACPWSSTCTRRCPSSSGCASRGRRARSSTALLLAAGAAVDRARDAVAHGQRRAGRDRLVALGVRAGQGRRSS